MTFHGKTVVLLGLLTAGLPLAAPAAGIAQITAHPKTFDGEVVSVSGTVSALRARTSRKGNPYETFTVCNGGCVHVFTFGQPPIRDGEQVTVAGTFAAVKHVGRYTFHNEIDTRSSDVHAGSTGS